MVFVNPKQAIQVKNISAEAGISVGLIYRYFKNKEEVIGALANEHKKHMAELLERAGEAPTLLEAMEILFTSHCAEHSPQIISAFVVDLFAEASRNSKVAKVVRDVIRAKTNGVADLRAAQTPRESLRLFVIINFSTRVPSSNTKPLAANFRLPTSDLRPAISARRASRLS